MNKKKKIEDNEEEDYIINNDQDIEEFQNINQNSKYSINNNIKKKSYANDISKEQNKIKTNKSIKTSHRVGGEWIKEVKSKYNQDNNNNKNNISKADSRISNNSKKGNKKIINFDEIPVGGGMGGGANFNIEIKVPTKKNQYIDNKNNNFVDNLGEKDIYLKKILDDKTNTKKNIINKKNNFENNYFYENDNKNSNSKNEEIGMERKNSLVSMITQTCDHEMVGRSEFIGIPINHNNLNPNISREINLDPNMIKLNEGKQNYSLYDKNENLFTKKNTNFKDNLDTSNFSSINKFTDFSTTQNLREKTESAIQLQNVQRELDNEIEMNKRLQGQIENYKGEFNNLREELVKKSDIINDLQQKISKLEKDLFLQGNQLIEAEAKPSQEHYEDIINNYEELKKNFDKAVERIKYLSEENNELKEKNIKLEENNKKLRKEIKKNKEKLMYMDENNNKNKVKKNNSINNNENEYDNEKDYEVENENNDFNDNNNSKKINEYNEYNEYMDYNNPIQNKVYNKKKSINNNKNNEIKNKNNNNNNLNEKKNKQQNINIEEKKEIVEKKSIIPEDNDIFGTRNFTTNKIAQRPRKIQEDGIPVIKRMEEKDNVKDIMVNNYATNDDDYYNRPPVGKPKPKRIKRNINNANTINTNNNNNYRNNNNQNNNINNYRESKSQNISETEKNNHEYKDNELNSNINEEEENNYINYSHKNNNNNFRVFSNINKENQNQRSIKGSITTSVGVFPSQLKTIVNEREILNLESKLFNLQKERDLINDEYLKFPEYPKKREEINAKRKIEIKLEEMNKEISLQKLKIRELKEQK